MNQGVASSLGSTGVGGAPGHGGHGHAGQNMLLIPQPMKSSLHGSSSLGATNGSGRKYQCKMCPQVRQFNQSFLFSFRNLCRNATKCLLTWLSPYFHCV